MITARLALLLLLWACAGRRAPVVPQESTTLTVENAGIAPIHLWIDMNGLPWWDGSVSGRLCVRLQPAEMSFAMTGERGASFSNVPAPMSAASTLILPPVTVLIGDGWLAAVNGDGGVYSLRLRRGPRCR